MILVVGLTVVGAMSISLTPMVLSVRDVLTSVIRHGNAVISSTPINAVLDGNVMKSPVNVNQTWLEKDMEVTLPALNTATLIQFRINTDAMLLLTHVINVHKIKLLAVIQIKPRLVRIARPHQRVSGNATRLIQSNHNVLNAKEVQQLIQIARADKWLAKTATHLKRCLHAIKRSLHVKKLHKVQLKLLVIVAVVILLQLNFLVPGEV